MILTKLVRVMIERLYRGLIDRIGGDAIITLQTRKSPRQKFNASLPDIPASLDYLVHWTISDLSGMADAQAEVLKGIEDCIDLAPLHNPTTSREFSWRGTDSVLPGVAHRPRYSPLHLFRPCGADIESRGRVESKRMIAARFLRSCRYSIWLAFALQKGQLQWVQRASGRPGKLQRGMYRSCSSNTSAALSDLWGTMDCTKGTSFSTT